MKKTVLLFATFFGLMSACQNEETDNSKNNPYKPIVMTKADAQIAAQNVDFAFCLFKAVENAAQNEGNLVISPLSASFALSMTANGANKETLKELIDGMGFQGFSTEEVNSYNQKLVNELVKLDRTSSISIANSLWMNNGFSVLSSYRESLSNSYAAETRQVDFASALTDINRWCSDQTKGCIPHFLDELNPDAQALLLNALYFKGQWNEPFDVKKTKMENFRNMDGTTAKVEFMNMENRLEYAGNEQFSMLRLCYGNKAFSLMILLPDEGVSLDQCLATINGSSWKALLESQNILPVNVKLPKFKIEGKSNLIPALESIGIRKPFSDEADFSKLSDEKVKVSEMRQANSFLIDEKGIEAAAVTEVDFGTTELPPTNPNQVVNFHADRPFIFLLTEQSTGCVLFIGKVTNMK